MAYCQRGRTTEAPEDRRDERRQRREGALVAVHVVRDETAGVRYEPAEHDEQDEAEDQDALPVGRAAVALLGLAETEQTWRVGDQSPVQHVADPDDHAQLQ